MIIMLMIKIIDNDLHHSSINHSTKNNNKEILQEFYVVTSSPRPSYWQGMQSLLILFAV